VVGTGPAGRTPGSAGLHLAAGVPLLHPGEQVFTAMLDGWRAQQLARNLAFSTIGRREAMVRAFALHADALPWRWEPQMIDEWLGDLRGVQGRSRSTVRSYASSVSAFCRYVTDPAYGWADECQDRFGTHPVQVVHEWNAAVHVQDNESEPRKRAFTLDELQALFDYADAQVARVRGQGRKGWLPVFRDAAAMKVAYGFGLRRTEAAMLDVADFAPNPHAPEFGDYGACQVRFGKALKGSPPKRRSVLTVWDWVPEILAQWIDEARPLMPEAGESPALWPSERAPRISDGTLHKRFAEYRDALGLEAGLDFHSLRRSYVTHLIEAGWDALFVQQQAGHEHASTTALYTCVSSDFRTRTLRRALDSTAAAAMRPGKKRT
jgi:integrase/recombinase XerC